MSGGVRGAGATPAPIRSLQPGPLGAGRRHEEDRPQVTTEKSPQAMASLRNLALGTLRPVGEENIAKRLRWAGRDPTRAVQLLGL